MAPNVETPLVLTDEVSGIGESDAHDPGGSQGDDLSFVSGVSVPDYELAVEGATDAVSVITAVMNRVDLVDVAFHVLPGNQLHLRRISRRSGHRGISDIRYLLLGLLNSLVSQLQPSNLYKSQAFNSPKLFDMKAR